MSFRCGVARRDILPAKPMFLVGYPHVARISTGVHDPIFASAAYFSDGSREILTLSLDLCYLMPQTVRAWREAIRAATGIPASHILVSPTHTHSAPQTAEILMWRGDPVVPRPDPDYMDLVARRVLAAAMEARASAVDAELAVTRAEARGVGRNRIARDGPMDYEVGILFARRKADGAPLAALTVYGMHPTVLHEDSTRISSDFPHFARRQIEESLPGSMVVYHNGPCGNLSPRYEVRGQTFAEAERLGRALGRAVVSAVVSLRKADFARAPRLEARQVFVKLPARRLPPRAAAERRLAAARAKYERLKAENAGHGPIRTQECVVFGREFVVRALKYGDFKALVADYTPTELQALKIGDAFLAGWPGELFVEYGLELKRRLPGGRTFIVTMANGELQGYIPTEQAVKEGAYEAGFRMFQPEAGKIMVRATEKLLRAMGAGG